MEVNFNFRKFDKIYFYLKEYFHNNELLNIYSTIEISDPKLNFVDLYATHKTELGERQKLTKNETLPEIKIFQNLQIETPFRKIEKPKSKNPTRKSVEPKSRKTKKLNTNVNMLKNGKTEKEAKKYYIKNYVKKEKTFFEHRNSLSTYNPILKNYEEYSKQRSSMLKVIPESKKSFLYEESNLSSNESEKEIKLNEKNINKSCLEIRHTNISRDSQDFRSSTPIKSNKKSILVNSSLDKDKKLNSPIKINHNLLNKNNLETIVKSETSPNLEDPSPFMYTKNMNFSFDLGYDGIFTEASKVRQVRKSLTGEIKSTTPVKMRMSKTVDMIEEVEDEENEINLNSKKLTDLLNQNLSFMSKKYETIKKEMIKLKTKLNSSINFRNKYFTKISSGNKDKFDFLNNLFNLIIKEYEIKELQNEKTQEQNKKKRSTTFLTKLSVIKENKLESKNYMTLEANGGIGLEFKVNPNYLSNSTPKKNLLEAQKRNSLQNKLIQNVKNFPIIKNTNKTRNSVSVGLVNECNNSLEKIEVDVPIPKSPFKNHLIDLNNKYLGGIGK